MNSRWKKYFVYAVIIIIGGGLLFIIVETVQAKNTGFETKTLWDWMELLVIPLVLATGAFYLNRSERVIERQAAEDRAKLEREIASDRQQEAVLQAYLDRIADSLLKEKLRTSKNKEIRNVARIRTLTVLRGLDANRKGMLLRFLRDSSLIDVIELAGADFSKTKLNGADLSRANLSGIHLAGADLRESNLSEADLRESDLSGTNLNTATFREAKLNRANLSGADLSGAEITDKQLATAKSLEGATLPDGTKHE
jgi:uncharacterized protein YjbI with pentapeptide repeats